MRKVRVRLMAAQRQGAPEEELEKLRNELKKKKGLGKEGKAPKE